MKSFVTVNKKKCVVCCRDFDTNELLIDKRMRDVFESSTLTGWGMCPEHAQQIKDGYTFLILIDENKSTIKGGSVDISNTYRLGCFFAVKNDFMQDVLGSVPPQRVAFIPVAVLADILTVIADSAPDMYLPIVKTILDAPKEQVYEYFSTLRDDITAQVLSRRLSRKLHRLGEDGYKAVYGDTPIDQIFDVKLSLDERIAVADKLFPGLQKAHEEETLETFVFSIKEDSEANAEETVQRPAQ